MKYNKVLLKDPWISPYVPETLWFSVTALKDMLSVYPTVFVKPNSNHRGNQILRIRNVSQQEPRSQKKSLYELCYSYKKEVKTCSLEEVIEEVVNEIKLNEKFIVQQGIDLATFGGLPFDLRILMHKSEERWQISGWLARVAKKGQIVTNHIRGAKAMPLDHVLKDNSHLNSTDLMIKLGDLAHQISQALGSYFDLRILALDMAVDKNGKLWFIEMNSDPMFRKMFKEIGNKEMVANVIHIRNYIIKKYKYTKSKKKVK
ncbi:YheD like protein [Desmospora sp. 8437]|nr:YheD like protein [Desmospora sp. 8437]